MTKSKLLLKAISMLTCVLYFATQHGAYAAELHALNSLRGHPEIRIPQPSSFFIPPEWGNVQELQGDAPQVVLIQDAHGQYEAQKNTAAILDFLHRQKGIGRLFLEGGAGRLDPGRLKFFNEPVFNRKAADLLAREAEAGGAEIFLVSNPSSKAPAYGLEDPGLYLQDLETFRQVMRARPEGEKYLGAELAVIREEAGRLFGADFKAFFKEWMNYESAQDLVRFLNPLESEARKRLRIDLNDPRDQLEWPQLVRFFELKKREPNLRPDKAKEERKILAEWAKRVGMARPFMEFLHGADSPFAGRRHFWETFYEAAHPKGFTFKDYLDLSLWVGVSERLEHRVQTLPLYYLIPRILTFRTIFSNRSNDLIIRYKTHTKLDLVSFLSAWAVLPLVAISK